MQHAVIYGPLATIPYKRHTRYTLGISSVPCREAETEQAIGTLETLLRASGESRPFITLFPSSFLSEIFCVNRDGLIHMYTTDGERTRGRGTTSEDELHVAAVTALVTWRTCKCNETQKGKKGGWNHGGLRRESTGRSAAG